MDALVFRSIKSMVLFGVMYLSLKYLGVANGAAIVVSLIPLVLGVLNVMTSAAYSIAALVFILAAFSSLLPANYDNAVHFVTEIVSNGMFERRASRSPTLENNEAKKPMSKNSESIKSR